MYREYYSNKTHRSLRERRYLGVKLGFSYATRITTPLFHFFFFFFFRFRLKSTEHCRLLFQISPPIFDIFSLNLEVRHLRVSSIIKPPYCGFPRGEGNFSHEGVLLYWLNIDGKNEISEINCYSRYMVINWARWRFRFPHPDLPPGISHL